MAKVEKPVGSDDLTLLFQLGRIIRRYQRFPESWQRPLGDL